MFTYTSNLPSSVGMASAMSARWSRLVMVIFIMLGTSFVLEDAQAQNPGLRGTAAKSVLHRRAAASNIFVHGNSTLAPSSNSTLTPLSNSTEVLTPGEDYTAAKIIVPIITTGASVAGFYYFGFYKALFDAGLGWVVWTQSTITGAALVTELTTTGIMSRELTESRRNKLKYIRSWASVTRQNTLRGVRSDANMAEVPLSAAGLLIPNIAARFDRNVYKLGPGYGAGKFFWHTTVDVIFDGGIFGFDWLGSKIGNYAEENYEANVRGDVQFTLANLPVNSALDANMRQAINLMTADMSKKDLVQHFATPAGQGWHRNTGNVGAAIDSLFFNPFIVAPFKALAKGQSGSDVGMAIGAELAFQAPIVLGGIIGTNFGNKEGGAIGRGIAGARHLRRHLGVVIP